MKALDVTRSSPGRHRTPELVRLACREPGRYLSETHHLLLKQGHSLRFVEHRLDFFCRIRWNWLNTAAAAQIGVNHIALNRTWPHQSYFDDEIVKTARLETWQHR